MPTLAEKIGVLTPVTDKENILAWSLLVLMTILSTICFALNRYHTSANARHGPAQTRTYVENVVNARLRLLLSHASLTLPQNLPCVQSY